MVQNLGRTEKVIKVEKIVKNMTSEELKKNR